MQQNIYHSTSARNAALEPSYERTVSDIEYIDRLYLSVKHHKSIRYMTFENIVRRKQAKLSQTVSEIAASRTITVNHHDIVPVACDIDRV